MFLDLRPAGMTVAWQPAYKAHVCVCVLKMEREIAAGFHIHTGVHGPLSACHAHVSAYSGDTRGKALENKQATVEEEERDEEEKKNTHAQNKVEQMEE